MPIKTKPLQKPNLCIICNHSNDEEYWDSERYLDTPFVFDKAGRKYVCRSCVMHAAEEFGFLAPEKAKELVEENQTLKTENKEVRLQSDLANVIREASKTLAAGHPGQAPSLQPGPPESVDDAEKVKATKIIKTIKP